jgi:hypothetical protein
MTKPDYDLVAVDLDDATQARVDALVPRFSKLGPVTSSDVLRALLEVELEKAEKDPEQLAAQLRAKR